MGVPLCKVVRQLPIGVQVPPALCHRVKMSWQLVIL